MFAILLALVFELGSAQTYNSHCVVYIIPLFGFLPKGFYRFSIVCRQICA